MTYKHAWAVSLLAGTIGCVERTALESDLNVAIPLPDASMDGGPAAPSDAGSGRDASSEAVGQTSAAGQASGAAAGRLMRDLTPQPIPPAGWPVDEMPRPGVVFDDARKRIEVFPGASSERPPLLPYTVWAWDGTAWLDETPAAPGVTPSRLWMQGVAFDRGRGVAVLFGGAEGPQVNLVAETWEWDGTGFALRQPPVSPPARAHQAMAYDPERKVTVIFGGLGASVVMDDLWEWDGATWTARTPGSTTGAWPSARFGASLVWDDRRHRLLMFGGQGAEILAELWAWDGTTWTDLTPAPLPDAWPRKRETHVAAFDPARGTMLLFGGATADGPGVLTYLRDLWEWDADAETFRNLTPPDASSAPPSIWPLPTDEAGAAFDVGRGRFALFGGETKPDGATGLSTPSALYEYGL